MLKQLINLWYRLFNSLLRAGTQQIEQGRISAFITTLRDYHQLYSIYSTILQQVVLTGTFFGSISSYPLQEKKKQRLAHSSSSLSPTPSSSSSETEEEEEMEDKHISVNPVLPLFSKKQAAFLNLPQEDNPKLFVCFFLQSTFIVLYADWYVLGCVPPIRCFLQVHKRRFDSD